MMLYLRLFTEFFKAGLFAVGGGLATLPFLYNISDKTGWFTHSQLADMVAVSESTPGPIGVNMATYVGFTSGGIPGAVIATVGLITPSVIVILIIAQFLRRFSESKAVQDIFYGLRAASVALITAALLLVVKVALFREIPVNGAEKAVLQPYLPGIVLAAVLLPMVMKTKLHPAVFLAASAVIGIVFRFAGA